MKRIKCPKMLRIFVWGALSFSILASGEATDLHAILIVDTVAVNIGPSVEADLQKVEREINRISFNADLSIAKYVLKGEKITSEGILATIRSLPTKEEDIVFFYFSGHGYRTLTKKSKWPNLFITNENSGIDFDLICQEVEKKCPRLMIIFADVCNNIVPDVFTPPLISKNLKTQASPPLKNAYMSLYRDFSGKIFIAGAKTGEFAWCTPEGALFTNAWIESMKDEGLFGGLAEWQTVLNRASLTVKADQNPFFEIHIK